MVEVCTAVYAGEDSLSPQQGLQKYLRLTHFLPSSRTPRTRKMSALPLRAFQTQRWSRLFVVSPTALP